MAAPITGYTELDLIGFTDKGNYDPNATYFKNDLLLHSGIKWRVLTDNLTGVTPKEGANYTVYMRAVETFNGRSGSVLPMAGDYDAPKILLSSAMHIGGETQTNVEQTIRALDNRITNTGVLSFNGRSGSVLPKAGDYNATQVDYDASHTVKQMIDSINHKAMTTAQIIAGTDTAQRTIAANVLSSGINSKIEAKIYNALDSSVTTNALSAAQGRQLNINKPNYNTFYSTSRKTNDVNGGNSIGAGVYLLLDDQAAITTGSGVPNGSAFTSSNCTKITGGVLNYIVKPTQITVTRSITPSGSEVFACWRSGNVATLFMNNVTYTNSYSADTKIATLACKPKATTRATFYNENLGIIPILIDSSGNVYLSQYTAGKHIYGSVTFVCNV